MSGEWDVGKIERGLTAKGFMAWEHYAQLEPFGEMRADIRIALLCQLIANVNRGPKQRPYELKDFLLDFSGEREQQGHSRETQISVIRAIAMAYSLPAKEL